MSPPLTRRRLLAGGATGVAVVLAGCADTLRTTATASRDRGVSEARPDLDAAAFDRYVARMADRYGDHGVWGPAPDGVTADLTFVGAWTGSATAGPAGDPLATADLAAALYRLPADDGRDRSRDRWWLWAAARPADGDSGLGRTTLTELSVGVSLRSGTMGPYAPGTTVSPERSPATIAPVGPGVTSGPRGTLVVEAGRVQTSREMTRVGDGGGFGVQWAGVTGTAVSVAGVCETDRSPDRPYDLSLPFSVAAGRGLL